MPKKLTSINLTEHDTSVEEVCFVEYAKNGSLTKTKAALTKQGVLTSGGKPLDITVIAKRAYHWLAFHPVKAREYIQQFTKEVYADDDWVNFWATKSLRGLNGDTEVLAWMREYGVEFNVTDPNKILVDLDTLR